MANAMHGLLDVFGVARDETARFEERMLDLTRSMVSAVQSAESALLAMGSPFSAKMKELQSQAVAPLIEVFELLEASSPQNALQDFQDFLTAVGGLQALQDGEAYDADADEKRVAAIKRLLGLEESTFGITAVSEFQRRLSDAGINMAELGVTVESVFGQGSSIVDVASRMYDVRDAFEGVSDSASKLISGMSDVEQIAIRAQAQREFQKAGADPFERAAVFRRMETQLQAAIGASASMQRRMRRVGVSTGTDTGTGTAEKVAAGSETPVTVVPVGVTLESFSVTDFEEMIQLPDASRRIVIAWEDAVFINDKYGVNGMRPQSWEDIVTIPTVGDRLVVNWEDVVLINDKYGVGGSRPHRWADVVSQSKIDEMKSIEKKWSDAIDISRVNLSDYGVRQWSDIVRLERASQSIGGSYSHTPGLSRHQRSWAQVIDLRPADLSDYGINRWSQMVLLSRESGGLSKHVRSFADLVDIRPTTLSMSSMIRLQPVRVTAAELIKVTGRLKLSALIDMSELDKRIDSRVAKTREQQRYRDDPTGFMERPGGYGG